MLPLSVAVPLGLALALLLFVFSINLVAVPESFFPVLFLLAAEEEPPDNKINKLLIVLGKKTQLLALVLLWRSFSLTVHVFYELITGARVNVPCRLCIGSGRRTS